MAANPKPIERVAPEDEGALVVKLPARVHIAAVVAVIALGGIWYQFGQDTLKNTLGILVATLAFYSAFYARTAILSARERERRIETLKYSQVFSDAVHIAARTSISYRFGQILHKQTL